MRDNLRGVRADRGQSYKSLEKYALLVRQSLDMATDKAFDARKFFEFSNLKLEHPVHDIRLVTGVSALPPGTEALTRFDPESHSMEMLLSEDSYRMLCSSRNRRGVYTVVHELGHATLHTDALIRLAECNMSSRAAFHRGGGDHPAYLDTEWQANAFASALLMPAAGLRKLEEQKILTMPAVSYMFGTSLEAARIRMGVYQTRKGELL